MQQSVQISLASKDELHQVYTLEKEVFAEHGYPCFFVRQAFDCWPNGLLVIKYKEKVQGYLLQVPSSEHREDAWILSVAVSSEMRGCGMGKALVEYAISHSSDYKRLLLTVSPDNTSALYLYQSLGFSIVKQEEDYFDIGETRLVLALILKSTHCS